MLRFRARIWCFTFIVFLMFGAIFYRLWELQVLRGAEYHQFSENNSLRRIPITAPRGKILDRQGRVLADNRPTFILTVVPAQLKNPKKAVHTLAYLLNEDPKRILEKLDREKTVPPFTPIALATSLTPEILAGIRGRMTRAMLNLDQEYDLSGINLSLNYERVYPYGEVSGHLLGYVREATQADLDVWEKKEPGRVDPGDKVGVTGMEKLFDEELRGYDGYRQAYVDAMGHEVDIRELGIDFDLVEEVPPQPGKDIRASVDAEWSRIAYEAFGEHVGSLVAVDPQNGEVLAMVSKPAYRPEVLSGAISPMLWKELNESPDKILLHRPLQSAYPPGSTYKIVTAIAALAEGKVDWKERISCPGYYSYGNRRWGCWKRGGHGSMDLRMALIQSCDVFFYRMGERLGADALAKYAKLLGLGQKTGVLADTERNGIVPTEQWKLDNRHEAWRNSDNLGNAIGQGFNIMTPMQSAMMIAKVANGGHNVVPHLRKDLPGSEAAPVPVTWQLKPEDHQKILDTLVEVVSGGTGKNARVEGVRVGGKTGTAQVVSLGRQGKPGVKTGDHAWFVAFAPAEEPRIAIATMVEHAGGGGKNAAPIAQKVLQAYFHPESLVPAAKD